MSWTGHQVVARFFIEGFGSAAQANRLEQDRFARERGNALQSGGRGGFRGGGERSRLR